MGDTFKTLKKAAQERLKDAEALLMRERLLGACYMAGYVVEFLLKAVILKEYENTRGLRPDTVSVDDFGRGEDRLKLDSLKIHKLGTLYTLYSGCTRHRTCVDWYTQGMRSKMGVLVHWNEMWRYEDGHITPSVDQSYAQAFVADVKRFHDIIRCEVGF